MFRTYLINSRASDEAMETVWSYLDIMPFAARRLGKTRRRVDPPDRTAQVAGTGGTTTTSLRPRLTARVEVSDAGSSRISGKRDAEAKAG